jgi:hypothetical protein
MHWIHLGLEESSAKYAADAVVPVVAHGPHLHYQVSDLCNLNQEILVPQTQQHLPLPTLSSSLTDIKIN